MKAEQAWQAALGQLQQEMPKATFDTWVRDAELVNYEDNVFVIGVPNAYARDWLEGRLSSTVTRLLTGIMNQTIEVRFTVWQSGQEIDEDVEANNQDQPFNEEDKKLKIETVHLSLRESLIHPERVVVVPGYFRRWLPYLGTNLAWIVVAFRQVMYLATRHKPEENPDTAFEISTSALARWAGMDRSTVCRHLDDWLLGWFVKRTASGSNTFRFIITMPLSPNDAEILYNWLIEAGAQDEPVNALEKALAVEIEILRPNPPPSPRAEHLKMKPNPQSVQDVVLQACGRMDKAALVKVMDLADRLATRLMSPGDDIHIPHYFIRHHLSDLGPLAGWFVVLMRDRCYIKRDEVKESIWIRGGYDEIMLMLGLRRRETVNELLPPLFEVKSVQRPPKVEGKKAQYEHRRALREERRNLLQRFIQRVEYQENPGATAWNFTVNQGDPLTPEHQAIYDWVIDLVADYLESGNRSKIDDLLAQSDSRLQQGDSRMQQSDSRLQQGDSRLQQEIRVCNVEIRECDALNYLNYIVKQLETKSKLLTTTTDAITNPPEKTTPVIVVSGNYWELTVLLSHNPRIYPKIRTELAENEASAEAFVSWLIYAASPQGSPTDGGRKGIENPPVYAANRLREAPQTGAGEVYNRLAQLPPKTLGELVAAHIADTNPSVSVSETAQSDWQAVMSNATTERVVALKCQLFGE